jgi:hypothetical protein
MTDKFQPDAAVRRVTPDTMRGLTGKRGEPVIVDDLGFDDATPIAHVGRRSIPKSHRAEGRNFVD